MGIWLLLVSALSSCQGKESVPGDGLYARLKTNKGDILLRLEFQRAPLTVMSFVGLAEGLFDAPDAPATLARKRYFDGLSFHRVEPGFVIQGGDPDGSGSGGPGYEFPNEIDPSLKHDAAGVLSMANAGPDTNGSQFFITLAPASALDGDYSVFGQVVEGMEVVKNIAVGDVMQKVTIIRQGAAAKAFKVSWEAFQRLSAQITQQRKQKDAAFAQQSKEALQDFAAKQWPQLQFAEQGGLLSAIVKPGSGKTGAQRGDIAEYLLHYTLWAPSQDGQIAVLDSSVKRGKPIQLAPSGVIQAWSQTMPQMQLGEKRVILVPSELGYGSRGSPPSIQPYSYLLFEMELLEFVAKGAK